MKAANQICDATKTRTVTLEGDVYDPSGTGWIQTSLARHYETYQLDRSDKGATEKQATLKAVTVKLDSMRSEFASYDKLSSDSSLPKGT
jgi:structural maintenance of chromosome 2